MTFDHLFAPQAQAALELDPRTSVGRCVLKGVRKHVRINHAAGADARAGRHAELCIGDGIRPVSSAGAAQGAAQMAHFVLDRARRDAGLDASTDIVAKLLFRDGGGIDIAIAPLPGMRGERFESGQHLLLG